MASVACAATAISTIYGSSTVFQTSTELLPTTYVAVAPNSVFTAFRTAGKVKRMLLKRWEA